jgi:hypothetical protein
MVDDDAVALQALAGTVAAAGFSVACAQNRVENERAALRLFANVYAGVCSPVLVISPGVVEARSAPVSGPLDTGGWPLALTTLPARSRPISRVPPSVLRHAMTFPLSQGPAGGLGPGPGDESWVGAVEGHVQDEGSGAGDRGAARG